MGFKKSFLTVFLLIIVLGLTGCNKSKEKGDTEANDAATPTVSLAETSTVDVTKTPENTSTADTKEEVKIPKDGIAFSYSKYYYAQNIDLEILSDKAGSIYYTTDGTDPSKDKTLYSGAIELEADSNVKATAIKAKAFFDDGTESDTIVHTYFVGLNALERFDTLVFSVTTDPYNLYDNEYGIFVEGKLRADFIAKNPNVKPDPDDPANFNMRGPSSEREVYLEIIDPKGSLVVGQEAGIRTYGGWSRAREQKSIKIFARKEYDEKNNKLDYLFFPDKTSADGKGNVLDSFKQLVLRNCGNDNGFGFIRDELFQTLAGKAGYSDYEAVRPAALFVDGDYRGFFWLHDVYGDEYFSDNYGDYKGKFEILEGEEKLKYVDEDGGNQQIADEFNGLYNTYSKADLTDNAVYDKLSEQVDIKNYLEYYALETYIDNEDWPHNNYRTYRYYPVEGEAYSAAPFDGKWRFLLHDLDFSFGIYGQSPYENTIDNFIGAKGEAACPLFNQLMKRADCREIFIKKTLDLLNGSFAPANLSSVLDTMNAERLNELGYTYDKSLLEDWVHPSDLASRIEDIKSYDNARATSILNGYQKFFKLGDIYQLTVKSVDSCKVSINSYVTDKDFKGSYYSDIATEISAVLPKGKKIDYWIVNGEKVKGDNLTVASSMIKDAQVEVSFVIK